MNQIESDTLKLHTMLSFDIVFSYESVFFENVYKSKMVKRPRSPVEDVSVENEETDNDDDDIVTKDLTEISFKDFEFDSIKQKETRGELNFRPIYQRGFKWKQKQSSLFIESILLGYPCQPVTFLKIDDEGSMECIDGQQRLTTIKNYVQNILVDAWKTNKNMMQPEFGLKGLAHKKEFENYTFKKLPKKEQNKILQYNIHCCIIPQTWPFANVIDYFRRIQGGGTKMTNQEIRRVISRGAFTDILDSIANADLAPYATLRKVLETAKMRTDPDEYQELFLRFFTLQSCNIRDFGTPSIQDHTLKVMKKLNKDSETTDGSEQIRLYTERLKNALELALCVFPDETTIFQRAIPLNFRIKQQDVTKIWAMTTRINKSIWDCVLYVFSIQDKSSIIENCSAIRDIIVDLMQTHPSFAKTKLAKGDTEARIDVMKHAIQEFLNTPITDRRVYGRERQQIILNWMSSNKPCDICKQRLSNYPELCHVDHQTSLANGGQTNGSNLVVTHKTCNLKKGRGDAP